MSTATLKNTTVPVGDLADLMAANRDAINAAVAAHRNPTRVALYARISSDPDETEEGVDEQLTDLRRYAATRLDGLPVVAEYVDDDRSAFKASVRRDRFEDMLRDAQLGLFDAVLVRDTDRLYRRLAELPRIAEQLVPHAQIIALMEGDVDLTTAAGILRAQMLGAVAEHESRRKAERVAANARHRAQGGVMTASVRPFGWAWRQPCDAGEECRHPARACAECRRAKQAKTCTHRTRHEPGARPVAGSRAGLVPHPTEAPALATAYQKVADGASLRQVARWLTAQGFSGAKGAVIRPEQMGAMLKLPRHAGLVAHNGRLVADAKDEARIVDVNLWQQVQIILDDEGRRTSPGRPANTALTGIATCGRCGGPMAASNKHSAGKRLPEGERGPRGGRRAKGAVTPVYVCSRNLHLTKSRALVDDYVLATIGLLVVDHAERLAGEARTDARPAELVARREVGRLQEQIRGYQRLAGQMDPDDLVAVLNGLRAQLVEAEQRAAVVTRRPAVARLTATGDVAGAWAALVAAEDREPLRQVIGELVESVTVHPRPTGGGRAVPVDEAVQITWQPWVRAAVDSVVDTVVDAE